LEYFAIAPAKHFALQHLTMRHWCTHWSVAWRYGRVHEMAAVLNAILNFSKCSKAGVVS